MIEPYVTEKQCGKCGDCKPVSAFSVDRKRADGRHPYCAECRKGYLPKPAGTKAPDWSTSEDAIVVEFYPLGGADMCAALLARSKPAIVQRAYKLDVLAPEQEEADGDDAWPIPAQDFASEHLAWQAVRVPAMEPAANLVPSLGRAA